DHGVGHLSHDVLLLGHGEHSFNDLYVDERHLSLFLSFFSYPANVHGGRYNQSRSPRVVLLYGGSGTAVPPAAMIFVAQLWMRRYTQVLQKVKHPGLGFPHTPAVVPVDADANRLCRPKVARYPPV